MPDRFQLESLDHIAIAVRDVEASRRWYADVLGLERRHEDTWGEVPTMMAAGSTMVALFPLSAEAEDGAPAPAGGRSGLRHFAFRADRANFDRARAELERRGLEVEFEDHTIAHSIYFRDPDGLALEITTYEV